MSFVVIGHANWAAAVRLQLAGCNRSRSQSKGSHGLKKSRTWRDSTRPHSQAGVPVFAEVRTDKTKNPCMAGLNSSTQEMWCPLYADIRVELNSSAWQASMHPLFFFFIQPFCWIVSLRFVLHSDFCLACLLTFLDDLSHCTRPRSPFQVCTCDASTAICVLSLRGRTQCIPWIFFRSRSVGL